MTLNIENIGMKYFGDLSKVTILKCGNNDLEQLPELPEGLLQLHCQQNELSSLPTLPNSLLHLNCTGNKLEKLPKNIPTHLKYLDCSSNPIRKLQLILPPNLEYLNISNTLIDVLPIIPPGLNIELVCDGKLLKPYLSIITDDLNNEAIHVPDGIELYQIKQMQYNMQRKRLALEETNVFPSSWNAWAAIMYPNYAAKRVIDLALAFRNSGLPPYVVSEIIDLDRNRLRDLPAYSAFDVHSIVQTVAPILQSETGNLKPSKSLQRVMEIRNANKLK